MRTYDPGDPAGKATGPQVAPREPVITTSSNVESSASPRAVQPVDIADAVARASLADLFALLDPVADLVAQVTHGHGFGPCRCPACGRRAVEIENAATAWCAACGANHTRWSIGRRILDNRKAVQRVAAMVAGRRCA